MKSRVIHVLATLAILLGPVSSAGSVFAAPPVADPVPFDVGPEIRGWEASASRLDLSAEALDEVSAEPTLTSTPVADCTLDTKIFLILNDVLGTYQLTYFNLVAESSMTQVWVQANLAWPAGDPRPAPEVFCEQAQYLMGQFDSNIYPTEISFFGSPDTHDGSAALLPSLVPSLGLPSDYYADSAGRQIVLVSNVRDDNYYDPTYPIYIAGFYSPSFEAYFDRNVMTIDAYDWANRTGSGGTRPFLYEGVFAHEYQHLLHDDYDSDEETFINEGLSDFAMILTGYGVALTSHLGPAASNPENSLVVWGDQGDLEILTDYGQAALFQMYLYEQFGQGFTQALFHNPGNGIAGIDSTLDGVPTPRNFSDVYHDFSVAMLIDSNRPRVGRYNLAEVDFHLDLGTPDAPNPESFDTPGAPPWGTDYIWVPGDPGDLGRFSFNGADFSIFPSAWTSDGSVLFGGAGDLLDNWAIFPTTGGGTLSFDTQYQTEETWDFGFVQVSTDGGHNWTSLANAYTRSDHDPEAHPTIVANVPGLTGDSGGWVNMSFDLSPYAGQDILVAFRYVTDWAFSEPGWWIDNVMVDGNLISDGSDASIFHDITEYLPIDNHFAVTFIGIRDQNGSILYKVSPMTKIDAISESFMAQLAGILNWADRAVMLVTFDAGQGVTTYADYTYEFEFAGPAAAAAAGAER
jgi:hypothetical protein